MFFALSGPLDQITALAADGAILVGSIISLALTILAFRLGRAWIIKITADRELDRAYEEFKENDANEDFEYNDQIQEELF